MGKPWSFMSKLLVAAVLCGAVMAPASANAWGWHGGWGGGWGWRGGGVYFGFPGPIYVGPPVVYAGPPVVYAPGPPVYAAPAPTAAASCFAGAYICPLENPGPGGAPCTCPTNTGRVAGVAR